ncbi:MAG TPA: hypothetical protein VIK29_06945 [Paludibacter sp.]
MPKTSYAEQISKAQVMLAGLKSNAAQVARRGLDDAFLTKLEASRILAATLNDDQERLKADLKTKTAQLDATLAELEAMVSESQKIVKMDIDKDRWKEFGIDVKR